MIGDGLIVKGDSLVAIGDSFVAIGYGFDEIDTICCWVKCENPNTRL